MKVDNRHFEKINQLITETKNPEFLKMQEQDMKTPKAFNLQLSLKKHSIVSVKSFNNRQSGSI